MAQEKKSLGEIVKETLIFSPAAYLGTSCGSAVFKSTTFIEAFTTDEALYRTLAATGGYFVGALLIEGGKRLYYSRQERKEREELEALNREIEEKYGKKEE